MRIAVHSHSWSAHAGGGVLYVSAIASALAEHHDVELTFPGPVETEALDRVLPGLGARPAIRRAREPKGPPPVRRLRQALADLAFDRVVVQSTAVPRACLQRNTHLLCEFPATRSLTTADRLRLATFRGIVANSRYTAGWIERWWQRQAEVLHPPVVPIAPRDKRPWILTVGRIRRSGRSKRQLDLIELFGRLVASGLDGWELHVAGFVGDRDEVARLESAAAGLPVRFHYDLERAELESLFGHASVLWHAVGAGVDPERHPERMEHFGIVTAEAMSAGAVPVVVRRGGQPEIVGDDGAGLLWDTFEECGEQTLGLISDAGRLRAYAQRARRRSERFSFDAFAQRAEELFG